MIYLGSAREPPLSDVFIFLGSARILSVSLTNKAKMHRAQMLPMDIKHELYHESFTECVWCEYARCKDDSNCFSSTESHSKITCGVCDWSTVLATQSLQIVSSQQRKKQRVWFFLFHISIPTCPLRYQQCILLSMSFFLSPLRIQHSIIALSLFSAVLVHTVCGVSSNAWHITMIYDYHPKKTNKTIMIATAAFAISLSLTVTLYG